MTVNVKHQHRHCGEGRNPGYGIGKTHSVLNVKLWHWIAAFAAMTMTVDRGQL